MVCPHIATRPARRARIPIAVVLATVGTFAAASASTRDRNLAQLLLSSTLGTRCARHRVVQKLDNRVGAENANRPGTLRY